MASYRSSSVGSRGSAPGRHVRAGRLRALPHLLHCGRAQHRAWGISHAGRAGHLHHLSRATGWNPFLILLIVIPLFILVGFAYQKAFIKPILNRPPRQLLFSSIVVTVGIATAIEDTASFIWGPTVKGSLFSMPCLHGGRRCRLFPSPDHPPVDHRPHGLSALLPQEAFMGKAIRAILQNREGALVIGINVPE